MTADWRLVLGTGAYDQYLSSEDNHGETESNVVPADRHAGMD